MWVITVFTDEGNVKMFEFKNEKEAKESIQQIKGIKILSHIIYFNDELAEAI